MKKKISHIHALLLLPLATASPLVCMEKELGNPHEKHLLEESMIITEEQTGSLGWLQTPYDKLCGIGPNVCSELRNRSFPASHTAHERRLNSAFDYFVSRKDEPGVLDLCQLCVQNYPRQIKTGDSQARMKHKFFVTNNKDKQKNLADTIKKNDEDFIKETNEDLAQIKATLNTLIQKVQAHHSNYIEQKNNLIKEKSTDIRNTKQGLTHTHQLNQTFKLPKDAYCSDDEEKNKEEGYYSDAYILKKIGIDYASSQTTVKAEILLRNLDALNSNLQAIQPLKADHFEDNK